MRVRTLLAAAALGVGVLGVAAAPATASDPHHEEQDGCDHGATGKDCKPDPQPDHGKDCEAHGNHGGINEDHCAPVEPSSTTTTTSSAVLERPKPETTVDTAAGPDGQVTPHLGCNDLNGFPYVTNIDQGGCPGPSVADLNDAKATRLTELPRTGTDWGLVVIAGIGLIVLGVIIRGAANR